MKKTYTLILLFLLCFIFDSCSNEPTITSFSAMNTFMTVKSFGKNAKKSNLQIKNEVERLEKILSTTETSSDIFNINNSDLSNVPIHSETHFLLEQSRFFFELTDGAFNPALYPIIKEWGFTTGNYKIPSKEKIIELLPKCNFTDFYFTDNFVQRPYGFELDFGAIGKGYAGDISIAILKQNGIKSAVLDFGGNIQLLGSKPDGTPWNIGIKNPWKNNLEYNPPVAILKLNDLCIITSGGYERSFIGDDGEKYIHIFDGQTGYPVNNNLESVTIICKQGLYGDMLSTSLFVMGQEKAINFWRKYKDFDFIILTKNKEILYSSSLNDFIKLNYDFNSIHVIE